MNKHMHHTVIVPTVPSQRMRAHSALCLWIRHHIQTYMYQHSDIEMNVYVCPQSHIYTQRERERNTHTHTHEHRMQQYIANPQSFSSTEEQSCLLPSFL